MKETLTILSRSESKLSPGMLASPAAANISRLIVWLFLTFFWNKRNGKKLFLSPAIFRLSCYVQFDLELAATALRASLAMSNWVVDEWSPPFRQRREVAKCDGPDNFHCDVMTFAFRLFILRRERKGGTSNEKITVNELKISRLMKFSCEHNLRCDLGRKKTLRCV